MNITIELTIFELVNLSNFILNNLRVEVYLVGNRKSEYRHRIKLIQITLDTKFHLKTAN